MGSSSTCARKTAKPIAMQAFFPQEAAGETAVSQTTKQRIKVPKNLNERASELSARAMWREGRSSAGWEGD